MGYRGAAFTRRRHRARAILLAFVGTSFGTFAAWLIALEVHFYTFTPFDSAPKVGWWFAATPVRIFEGVILQQQRNWNPADAPAFEIGSMCVANGFLAAVVCWVSALWLNRSDAGFFRSRVRSLWFVESAVFWRKVLILSSWGATLGGVFTLAAIGLAYLSGTGSDSAAFMVWGALCLPLHAVCAVVGNDWPNFNHGPSVLNVLAASLVNGVLFAAIFASLLLFTRFLFVDSQMTSS